MQLNTRKYCHSDCHMIYFFKWRERWLSSWNTATTSHFRDKATAGSSQKCYISAICNCCLCLWNSFRNLFEKFLSNIQHLSFFPRMVDRCLTSWPYANAHHYIDPHVHTDQYERSGLCEKISDWQFNHVNCLQKSKLSILTQYGEQPRFHPTKSKKAI